MTEGKRQKFPTWAQALIMIVAGFVIGFSSCAGALSQIGGGGSRVAGNILAIGFIVGAVLFLAGIVAMMIVVVRALVTEPQGEVISRSTHPQLFPDSVEGAAAQTESAGAALWRFRIAVIVSISVGAIEILRVAVGAGRLHAAAHSFQAFPLLIVAFALAEVPYGIALYRNRSGADRTGLGLALAMGAVSLIGMGPMFRYAYMVPELVLLQMVADVAVVAFAWNARKYARPMADEAGRIVAFFFGIWIYIGALRLLEAYLAIRMR